MKTALFSELRLGILFSIAVFVTVLIEPANAQTSEYAVTILGSLGGSDGAEALAINSSGEVVGASYTAGNAAQDAVEWTGTTPTILQTVAGNTTNSALGVNSSGIAVGESYPLYQSPTDAVEWTGTSATLLGSLGGDESNATAINSSGKIVGESFTGGTIDAVEWTGTTPTAFQPIVNGGNDCGANGINDSNAVVGYCYKYDVLYAVEWFAAGAYPQVLGSLGSGGSIAEAINNSGKIVGASNNEAVEWNGTTPTALGFLGGGNSSGAAAINSAGVIVGSSDTEGGASSGFVYTGGTMYNINNLLVPGSNVDVTGLSDINDSGQMVGVGTIDSQTYPVELTPVSIPEPRMICLLPAAYLLQFAFRPCGKSPRVGISASRL